VPKRRSESDTIREEISGIDRLLEHRVRLAISVLLTRNDSLTFPRLKTLLEETDGSLGAHLRKLEDAGYIDVTKEFRDRKPVTWYALTAAGRNALNGHLSAMQQLIRSTKGKR
jgi:DNA-binding PadR family transcriptional regulator